MFPGRRYSNDKANGVMRLLLTVAVAVSLVQFPVPVVHAHVTDADESLGDGWLYGHLHRLHGEGLGAGDVHEEFHWHFVLPRQFSEESGQEHGDQPLGEPSWLVLDSQTSGSLTASVAADWSGSQSSVSAVMLTDRPMRAPSFRPSEFVASYPPSVPRCALIGVSRR